MGGNRCVKLTKKTAGPIITSFVRGYYIFGGISKWIVALSFVCVRTFREKAA